LVWFWFFDAQLKTALMLNRPLMLQVNFLVFVEMCNTDNAVAGQEGYYNQGNMSTISSFCFKV